MLSFSPSLWGMSVFSDWKPALMLCMRRRSLLLAISRRMRRSWSLAVSGVRGMLARLGRRQSSYTHGREGVRKVMLRRASHAHIHGDVI